MAQRRMFSLQIVDTDAFLDMPHSSQLLYFHLSMRADDDGFISNPKKVMRMIGSQEDDYKVLLAKRFIIPFESGVCVIKHWKIHNYIQKDRYTPTNYIEEKSRLKLKSNNSYTECIQDVSRMETQDRIGKVRVRLGKDRIGKVNTKSTSSLDELPYKIIIEKYLQIKDISNLSNRVAIRKFVKNYTTEQLEWILKGFKYFSETEYPYIIKSVSALWEKREKILARMEQVNLQNKNKKGGVAKI